MHSNQDGERSPGGSRIERHAEPASLSPAAGEPSTEQISAHVEAHLGPVLTVFHELLSDAVHIDVLVVGPSASEPCCRLVTSGMSDLPMTVPDGADVPRHAELMMSLPGDWKLDEAAVRDERWFWPFRLLKFLARLPHLYGTWLGPGHTIPHGDPALPYAPGVSFTGAIVLPSVTVPEAFHSLRVAPDETIQFYAVVPLYPGEMELKLRAGTERLLDRLGARGVSDLVAPTRPDVSRKRFWLFG